VPVHELAPMDEGWYTIAVDARDRAGARYHPCGTGLVYLEAGSYRFRFELERTTRVEGRVEGPPGVEDLAVALVERSGEPVQLLRSNRRLDEVVPIGAGGRFALEGAPIGPFTLRVGREEELRAGRSLHAQDVTIEAGENAPVEVRLP
jgi:hypothetical protein